MDFTGLTEEQKIENLYQAYPRHTGKGDAKKAIKKALEKVPYPQLLEATMAYAESPRGKGQLGHDAPHPATWFNQERWADDRKFWEAPAPRREGPGSPCAALARLDQPCKRCSGLGHQKAHAVEVRWGNPKVYEYGYACHECNPNNPDYAHTFDEIKRKLEPMGFRVFKEVVDVDWFIHEWRKSTAKAQDIVPKGDDDGVPGQGDQGGFREGDCPF